MRRLLNRACASNQSNSYLTKVKISKNQFSNRLNDNRHSFTFTAAIQALKRKKRFEKQLQQIDGTLSTIEMQREALEGANTNTAVLTNMKSAADALKAAHQNMYVTIAFCFVIIVAIDLLISFCGVLAQFLCKHKGMSKMFTI